MSEILSLYEMSQKIQARIINTFVQVDQATKKGEEIDKLVTQLMEDPGVSCSYHLHLVPLINVIWFGT
jgi:hypothetical protein